MQFARALRPLAIAFTLITIGAATATAQTTPAKKDTPPSKETTKALVGTWEGSFSSDHASPGSYRLTIAYDNAWKVTSDVTFNDQPMPTNVSDFKGEVGRATWTQELMGGPCNGIAVVEKDTLKGNVTCGMGAMTITLVRK